jgi:hypothetical protein
MSTLSASTTLFFHPADNQNYALNFTQFGIGNRTIAAVNAVSAAPLDSLEFTGLTPNAAGITGEFGQPVAVGKAATWDMSGGAAGIDYSLTVQVTYSDGSIVNATLLASCRNR